MDSSIGKIAIVPRIDTRKGDESVRSLIPPRPADMNKRAKAVVDVAVGAKQDPPPPSLARQKAGLARAEALSPERRREIASKAGKAGAKKRWGNKT